jgi:hypothetical protein
MNTACVYCLSNGSRDCLENGYACIFNPIETKTKQQPNYCQLKVHDNLFVESEERCANIHLISLFPKDARIKLKFL